MPLCYPDYDMVYTFIVLSPVPSYVVSFKSQQPPCLSQMAKEARGAREGKEKEKGKAHHLEVSKHVML